MPAWPLVERTFYIKDGKSISNSTKKTMRYVTPQGACLKENPRLDSKIQKQILGFCTKQINPRSLRSWCIKATEESSSPRVDSWVPLTHYDPSDLGLICLVKKCKKLFSDFSGFKNPILGFRKVIPQYCIVHPYCAQFSRHKRAQMSACTYIAK